GRNLKSGVDILIPKLVRLVGGLPRQRQIVLPGRLHAVAIVGELVLEGQPLIECNAGTVHSRMGAPPPTGPQYVGDTLVQRRVDCQRKLGMSSTIYVGSGESAP